MSSSETRTPLVGKEWWLLAWTEWGDSEQVRASVEDL